jgi:hypothetical protein
MICPGVMRESRYPIEYHQDPESDLKRRKKNVRFNNMRYMSLIVVAIDVRRSQCPHIPLILIQWFRPVWDWCSKSTQA